MMGISSSGFRETPYLRGFSFAGQLYQAFNQYLAIGAGSHAYVEFRTGTSRLIHVLNYDVVPTDAPYDIFLIEAPTVFTPGTIRMDAVSENRELTKVETLEIYTDAVYTSGGIIIAQAFIPLGSASTQSAFESIEGLEQILKEDTTYIIDIHNNSNTSNTIQFNMTWYESGN